jgi:hypothetical protein
MRHQRLPAHEFRTSFGLGIEPTEGYAVDQLSNCRANQTFFVDWAHVTTHPGRRYAQISVDGNDSNSASVSGPQWLTENAAAAMRCIRGRHPRQTTTTAMLA